MCEFDNDLSTPDLGANWPPAYSCKAKSTNSCKNVVNKRATFCSESCWLDFESAQPRKDIKRGVALDEVTR